MPTKTNLITELEQYLYEIEMAGYTEWPEYKEACKLLDVLFAEQEKGA